MDYDLNIKIGKMLHKLRGNKNLTQIFRDTGVSDRHLSLLERGIGNPTLDTLKKLADYYGVKVIDLFEVKPIEYKIQIGKEKLIGERTSNFQPVPLLRDACSLGTGYEINEKDLDGAVLIHTKWLRRNGEYQAIWVKGDSMSPLFEDGEIVAVDTKLRNPVSLKGKFVACHIGNYEVMVKRFWDQKDKYYFEALNKKWERENGPIIVPKKDNLILGKVIWAWKKFD